MLAALTKVENNHVGINKVEGVDSSEYIDVE
jgi:hypothetical protein